MRLFPRQQRPRPPCPHFLRLQKRSWQESCNPASPLPGFYFLPTHHEERDHLRTVGLVLRERSQPQLLGCPPERRLFSRVGRFMRGQFKFSQSEQGKWSVKNMSESWPPLFEDFGIARQGYWAGQGGSVREPGCRRCAKGARRDLFDPRRSTGGIWRPLSDMLPCAWRPLARADYSYYTNYRAQFRAILDAATSTSRY